MTPNLQHNNPLTRLVRLFMAKLFQNPEFYNIRHYKKMKSRNRNQQNVW